MFYDVLTNLCHLRGTSVTALLKDLGLSTSKGTAWKKGSTPTGDILLKIANRLNVSTDYLLENDTSKVSNPPSRKDYMYAFFHGEEGVTDEMMDELEQYASMIKLREENKKKK